jgi:hypothetical protein
MAKTIKQAAIKHGIGVIVLIAVLIFVNFINIQNNYIGSFVDFFRENIPLLIFITVLHLLSDIFETFSFPVNIAYPFLKAFAVTAGVVFLFNFIEAAISVYSLLLALKITSLAVHVYRLIFVITLIISLLSVFKKKKKEDKK